jgi:ferric-dicitrate binding protein FerR (iron transport regulator)
MNERDPELDPLLSALRDGPVSVASPEARRQLRARVVGDLRVKVRQIPATRRRMRIIRRSKLGALAALLALGCAWVVSLQQSGASVVALRLESVGGAPLLWVDPLGGHRSLPSAADLEGAGELRVPADSSAQLLTLDRVHIQLSGSSLMRVRKGSSELHLANGEVHCRVPPLGRARSFSVSTPSARVVVHGTDFVVRVGGTTCVRVREGLVEIQAEGHRHFVRPGEQWGCEPTAPEPARALRPDSEIAPTAREIEVDRVPAPARSQRSHARALRHADGVGSIAPSRARGTLDAEIRLLSAALSAERTHDVERARSLFGELVRSYPRSPLEPEARAGLARLR